MLNSIWIFLLTLLLVVSLAACGSKTESPAPEPAPAAPPVEEMQPAEEAGAPAPEVPEDAAPIAVEMEVNGEVQTPTEPEEAPAEAPAEAPEVPQEAPSATEEPAPQPEPAAPHALEALLPADWAGRYVLEDAGNEPTYEKKGFRPFVQEITEKVRRAGFFSNGNARYEFLDIVSINETLSTEICY